MRAGETEDPQEVAKDLAVGVVQPTLLITVHACPPWVSKNFLTENVTFPWEADVWYPRNRPTEQKSPEAVIELRATANTYLKELQLCRLCSRHG